MRHRKPPSPTLVGTASALFATGLLWGWDARRRALRTAAIHRTMVELLLNTLCAGDPATARHSRRVADLTNILGRTYHLGREGHARLRVGALLHDLGKLDDHVSRLVHSDHQLSESERSQIEEHTNESADILEPLESIHPGISLIVESHHERWDGQGYPQGLAGLQIPLESRIISVADVFDAMTQPRPYHQASEPEAVLQKVREEAGATFDPDVVRRLGRREVWSGWEAIARAGQREEQEAAASTE